jgi:hypothetical protein
MVLGLDMRFLGGKRQKKIEAGVKAIKSMGFGLRPRTKSNGNSRSPSGMTTRKATATAEATATIE